MRKTMVVAPHPDDETLGCGGTILKHKAMGDEVYWLIISSIPVQAGNELDRSRRNDEIKLVQERYQFSGVYRLEVPAAQLDTLPIGELVTRISNVFKEVLPHTIYVPNRSDVHTDHKYVFDAVISCTKWFRYPSVRRVLAYETLSETEFSLNPDLPGFRPNVFVDISSYLDQKVGIMNIYASEVSAFPFPRSEKAIRSLAAVRGATAGCEAAEAFMLLKEIL